MSYQAVAEAASDCGLLARGGFHPAPEDLAPPSCGSVILIGNAGADFWPRFEAERRDEPHSLDAWTRRTVDRIAAKVGGWALYPSDGPPYFPFQRWAQKADAVFPSPIGLLIHAEFGLWHAYRAAICLHDVIPLPTRKQATNPCDICSERPCLTTCPVGAFQPGRYDSQACAGYLRQLEGADCLSGGCRARRACPVAGPDLYAPGQAGFHMQAFLAARGG